MRSMAQFNTQQVISVQFLWSAGQRTVRQAQNALCPGGVHSGPLPLHKSIHCGYKALLHQCPLGQQCGAFNKVSQRLRCRMPAPENHCVAPCQQRSLHYGEGGHNDYRDDKVDPRSARQPRVMQQAFCEPFADAKCRDHAAAEHRQGQRALQDHSKIENTVP